MDYKARCKLICETIYLFKKNGMTVQSVCWIVNQISDGVTEVEITKESGQHRLNGPPMQTISQIRNLVDRIPCYKIFVSQHSFEKEELLLTNTIVSYNVFYLKNTIQAVLTIYDFDY